ncbi:MAG: exodeoxyribonuclease III, partial [Pseudomonadales bacterium]|nr:exodeoxyribonuclease III [Pseudomonadales bacterium]
PGLRRFVKQAKIPRNVRFSQHAPVIIDYDWTLSI